MLLIDQGFQVIQIEASSSTGQHTSHIKSATPDRDSFGMFDEEDDEREDRGSEERLSEREDFEGTELRRRRKHDMEPLTRDKS